MNNIVKSMLVLAILVGVGTVGVQVASACGGFGAGDFGKRMRGGNGFGFIPSEMREEFKENFQNLSEQERAQLREQRKLRMQEHRAEMESFMGLSRKEIHDLRQGGKTMGEILTEQGKTEADAEEFLTERAEERVNNIVERHGLSEEQEKTLRDRIAEFVQRILEKWFGGA